MWIFELSTDLVLNFGGRNKDNNITETDDLTF